MRISKEMKELKKILKAVPEDKQPIAQSLFTELVFMQNTLIKLKENIQVEGETVLFKQGQQEFMKANPSLKAYNDFIQRFSSVCKQTIDLLPEVEKVDCSDPLKEFLDG